MATMMKKIRKLFLSDIHIGKGKNGRIVDELNDYVINDPQYGEVDYIIFSGDIYDKQISLGSEASIGSVEWMIDLGMYCIRKRIKLRMLEGTPYHDRRQVRMFETIVNKLMPELDFMYIDDITVVQESDHTCLYIPDEIRVDTRTAYLDAVKIMDDMGLTKVDSAVIHGAFKHSMGFGTVATLHVESDYLDLVKGFIVAGHIHTQQSYERIKTPGSFGRLSYGQEEPKGGLLIVETADHSADTMEFIENKRAQVFKDIVVSDSIITTPSLISAISQTIIFEEAGSHFRLLLRNEHLFDMREVIDTFSKYVINTKDISDDVVIEVVTMEEEEDFETITDLSREAVSRMIRDRLSDSGMANGVVDNVVRLLTKEKR